MIHHRPGHHLVGGGFQAPAATRTSHPLRLLSPTPDAQQLRVPGAAGEGGNDLLHGRNQVADQSLQRGNAALQGNIMVGGWRAAGVCQWLWWCVCHVLGRIALAQRTAAGHQP